MNLIGVIGLKFAVNWDKFRPRCRLEWTSAEYCM
jgi:hypothetical protein